MAVRFGGGGGAGGGQAMKIGGVTLENVTQVSESGGMDAPSKKTERGFSFTTRVGADPKSSTFKAWIPLDKYQTLADIRKSSEPVSVSVGFVSMGKCKIQDIRFDDRAQEISHYQVTIKVRQIQTPSTRTATVTATGSSGSKSSSSDSLEDPTLVRSQSENAGGSPSGGGGGPLDAVADWLGF